MVTGRRGKRAFIIPSHFFRHAFQENLYYKFFQGKKEQRKEEDPGLSGGCSIRYETTWLHIQDTLYFYVIGYWGLTELRINGSCVLYGLRLLWKSHPEEQQNKWRGFGIFIWCSAYRAVWRTGEPCWCCVSSLLSTAPSLPDSAQRVS